MCPCKITESYRWTLVDQISQSLLNLIILYFQNTSSELNQTNDGFLNSLLNDEDLQLMDMADSKYKFLKYSKKKSL